MDSVDLTEASGVCRQTRWFARYPWSFLIGVVGAMFAVGVFMAAAVMEPLLHSSLPKLEDFQPSLAWSCPNTVNSPRPLSCDTPVRVHVECLGSNDLVQIARYGRPFTAMEVRNLDAACELLPVWLDSDARLVVVPKNEAADVDIRFMFSPTGRYFGAFRMLATDVETQQTHEVVASTMAKDGTTAGNLIYDVFGGLRARGLLP